MLGIWTYDVAPVEPAFPIAFDPWYGEIVLRGLARAIPAMAPYLARMPRCVIDGGYYTKTRENRFLASPLPVEGAYVLGALSGYGLMASNGAADHAAVLEVGVELGRSVVDGQLRSAREFELAARLERDAADGAERGMGHRQLPRVPEQQVQRHRVDRVDRDDRRVVVEVLHVSSP